MSSIRKVQIGKILVDAGIITDAELQMAIQKQQSSGDRLGEVLVSLGLVTESRILELLAKQLNIPLVDVKNYSFDPVKVQLMPEMQARRYRAIILEKDDSGFLVGMADPQDVLACDEISKSLNAPVRVALVNEDDLLKCIDMIYRHTAEISTLAEEVSVDIGQTNDFDVERLSEGISEVDAPIMKLLQSIFEDAVQVEASDVHIEPDESVLRIRQRIDGYLHEQILKEKRVADAITLRLKLMAGLNITEKRLPQDGRFSIRVHGHNYDVRMSTLPTQWGESVVLRLLNQSAPVINLIEMGASQQMMTRLTRLMALPHGILLVTGPTGSGKTTTLYSLLNGINQPDIKIITVEDPVEYRIPRITQVQVQPRIELGFARVLRAILRQDPDVIMIGELRDQETVSIAMRAAMTGHLVLATLHTNDASSSVIRLLDMGAEGYIVASVLRGVLAQRLVRRICSNCVKPAILTYDEEVWLKAMVPSFVPAEAKLLHGTGCPYCHNTGYKGQIGVFELLELNMGMADALRMSDSKAFIHLALEDKNFHSLLEGGMALVKEGVTTLSEVMRIIGAEVEENVSLREHA